MEVFRDNYQLLIEKLDGFIRKYYINQLIRGGLYTMGLVLVFFLFASLLEYFFYFNTGVRKFLYYSFLGTSVLTLGNWVVLPLLHYFRLGKVISHEQAASIIGDHFSNVKDKLLNILQLKAQSDNASHKELILASIRQKSDEISIVPFQSAINLTQNKKYLRYALPPLLVLLALLIGAPSLIKDSTHRLINNDQEFRKPAAFQFLLSQDSLQVEQFRDFTLEVSTQGRIIPNEVYIEVDNYQYRMDKVEPNRFSYVFRNVSASTPFHVFSGDVISLPYTLDVIRRPNLTSFDVKLIYPAYTGKKSQSLQNTGDLTVPEGTQLTWSLQADHTDRIEAIFPPQSKRVLARQTEPSAFALSWKALKSGSYTLFISNQHLKSPDSVSYSLSVSPDLHPVISCEKFVDSLDKKLLFFAGEVSDDYGITNLTFNYRIRKSNGEQGDLVIRRLPKPGNPGTYEFNWDLRQMEIEPGSEISYYFEVFDNDGVNGIKSSRSGVMTYTLPTAKELDKQESRNNESIQKDIEQALREAKSIQEDAKRLQEKMLQQKEMDWQTRKEIDKLSNRQKDLQEKIEDAKEKFEENKENQSEFSNPDEKILQQQEEIQKMFDELASDEMKKMMEEIQKMLQELQKDQAMDKMEEMKMSNEELSKNLDRLQEWLKELEVEKDVQDQIQKLDELSKKQEELGDKTEQKSEKQEELQEKQEQLNKEFNDLQKDMKEIMKKNEELERPKQLGNPQEQMQDIQQDMQDSKENLQQQQNGKASQSQKKASKKMKDMARSMEMNMQGGDQEQAEEDMKALRQLMENLLSMSFSQEGLIKEGNKVTINTPAYTDLVQKQYKLKDDFRIIDDSLQALSKRVVQIQSFITEKVTEVKSGLKNSIDNLEERQKPQAQDYQQRTMKNVNDLALMLSEVMNSMQNQSQSSGSGSCNKPGGSGSSGKVPKDKLSKGQQNLNEMMQKMMDRKKNGKGSDSKEFAQMAARQAALRKALEQMQKDKQRRGQQASELQKLIDEMDKVETDLVNKKLTQEMMKRQEEILTRLLESERAEREREYEEERKSESAKQIENRRPPALQEYLRKREAELDMYKTVTPNLKPYYRYLVEEYLKSVTKK